MDEQEQRERNRPVGGEVRATQKPLDKGGDEPEDVQGDDEWVVSLPPLDGTQSACFALVGAGEHELEEALQSHNAHRQHEQSGGVQRALRLVTRRTNRLLIAGS